MKSKSKTLGRRDFVARLGAGGLAMVASNLTEGCGGGEHIGVTLENESLALIFDRVTGLLTGIQNKLSDETLRVRGDDFRVVAEEFSLTPRNMRLDRVQKNIRGVGPGELSCRGTQCCCNLQLGGEESFLRKIPCCHLRLSVSAEDAGGQQDGLQARR